MRTATKLLVIGSAIGAAMLLGRRRPARRRPELPGAGDLPSPGSPEPEDLGLAVDRGAGDVSPPVGIFEVDPQPLTQISAEGIDPDATRAAHEDPPEQRERLAVPGKNLP